MLWLYLAMGLVWMGSAYVITVNAIVRHDIRVDSGGNLLGLGQRRDLAELVERRCRTC